MLITVNTRQKLVVLVFFFFLTSPRGGKIYSPPPEWKSKLSPLRFPHIYTYGCFFTQGIRATSGVRRITGPSCSPRRIVFFWHLRTRRENNFQSNMRLTPMGSFLILDEPAKVFIVRLSFWNFYCSLFRFSVWKRPCPSEVLRRALRELIFSSRCLGRGRFTYWNFPLYCTAHVYHAIAV